LDIFYSKDTRIISYEHPDVEIEYKRKCPSVWRCTVLAESRVTSPDSFGQHWFEDFKSHKR
jgi:hypothetical protein